MPTTLLTGANGFVAASVLDQLIKEGHFVVGQVRSASKAEDILATHPEYKGHFSHVVVADYTSTGTWDETFKTHDFDYVIHTAAPLLDDPHNSDFDEHFLKPSVSGVTELLKSALKYGKNVKAIAVTGSVNAMTTGSDINERIFSSSSWLPVTIADARAANNNYISYCVAKAESEKAIWTFISEHHPPFHVTVLLPALIFGPPIQPVADVKKINFSTDAFYALFNGSSEVAGPTMFPSFVDVRDLAYAHVKSLTTESVAGKRMLIGGNAYSSQLALDSLKGVPELEGRLAKSNGEDMSQREVKMADVKEWNEKLGLVPRTPQETFVDAAKKILELEKKFGK